ncbi:hypothetical protein, partial [Xanthobacter autotrophicus]
MTDPFVLDTSRWPDGHAIPAGCATYGAFGLLSLLNHSLPAGHPPWCQGRDQRELKGEDGVPMYGSATPVAQNETAGHRARPFSLKVAPPPEQT